MPPSSVQQQPSRSQLRPTLPGPHRYDLGHQERQVQQAGRSATSLNAQASAQSLREAARLIARDAPSHSPPHTPLDNTSINTLSLHLPSSPPLLHAASDSRYSPAVPSPLNPASVANSNSDDDGSRESGSNSSGDFSSASGPQQGRAPVVGTESSSIPNTSTTQSLLRPPEMSQAGSTPSLSLSSPRSVRDLGSDYTRYFNPFATRNNSQQDLPASLQQLTSAEARLHPNAAVSAADLMKRLSNPFADGRRTSNPFDSTEYLASPTPTLRSPEPDFETQAPTAVVSPVPPRSGTPIFSNTADPEKAPFCPWIDDRFSAPCIFPLYMDQQEDDDDMHMPRWDDDKRHALHWRERLSRDNIVNTIGMILLLTGLISVFIVLPIVSYTGASLIPYSYETPLDQMPGYGYDPWTHVNDRDYPLLQNLRTGLIDPDTPDSAKTRKSADGDDLILVFSDEFNEKNRTFYPGDDPFWYAPDFWYGATGDLEWYDPDAVNTGDGTLQLQLDAFANHGLGFRSGMLNSWNQLCFKGGAFEVSMSLPGPAGIHGLWPGAWTMGNLGRPGYLASTDGVWPYTYDSCDAGITPNQSQSDGLSFLPGQRLANCVCHGEDHPTPGTGRGAPEIDIAEVSGDYNGLKIGVATQSFQVAPFDIWYYPNYDFMENPNPEISLVNTWTGGPYQEAVSTTTMLNNSWYDGVQYQKYAFEYVPGSSSDSHITWYVGDEETMKFDARAIGPNGNVNQRIISEEPMSMILNLGFSHSWVDIDMANLRFPAVMRVDYVRWYQKEGQELVTCDPPGYETTDYIARHPVAYNNQNLTRWDEAGYSRPKNSLMDGCAA